MTQALREKLGKVAYTAFYPGVYGSWETASEKERERWRDAGEAAAQTVVGYIVQPLQALLREEDGQQQSK